MCVPRWVKAHLGVWLGASGTVLTMAELWPWPVCVGAVQSTGIPKPWWLGKAVRWFM